MVEALKPMLPESSLPPIFGAAAAELSDTSSSFSADSSDDLSDDAVSPTSSLPSPKPLVRPVFELSSLMANLPIRRGLSKHYQGKSQSFTSLAEARTIEDLPKKETPYQKRMRASKSYAGGLHVKTIAKKPSSSSSSSRASCGSLASSRSRMRSSSSSSSFSFLHDSKPPPVPVHRCQ